MDLSRRSELPLILGLPLNPIIALIGSTIDGLFITVDIVIISISNAKDTVRLSLIIRWEWEENSPYHLGVLGSQQALQDYLPML